MPATTKTISAANTLLASLVDDSQPVNPIIKLIRAIIADLKARITTLEA